MKFGQCGPVAPKKPLGTYHNLPIAVSSLACFLLDELLTSFPLPLPILRSQLLNNGVVLFRYSACILYQVWTSVIVASYGGDPKSRTAVSKSLCPNMDPTSNGLFVGRIAKKFLFRKSRARSVPRA